MNLAARTRRAPIIRNIRSNRNRFAIIAQYPDRKPWWKVLWEMNVRYPRSDITKYDYMELGLFRKFDKDPMHILTYAQCRAVNATLNRPDLNPCFDDKLLFHETMARHNVEMAPLLGSFVSGEFCAHPAKGASSTALIDAQTALSFFKTLSGTNAFFAKTTTGSGGMNAFKVTPEMDTTTFVKALDGRDYLFEGLVEQTASVAAFNPGSLNTFRLYTAFDEHGTPHAVAGQFRVGRTGSVTDNASSGGISAAVDMTTGQVDPAGIIAASLGGGYFEHHPDTGHKFGGFKIPFFDECCDLGRKYARVLPNPIIGWDFALCDDGPLLIEGNRYNAFNQVQNSGGPMLSAPLFRKHAAHLYAKA